MTITSILHTSLIVKNTNIALDFYKGILELEVDNNRPDLGYPGVWLNIGEQQIHLLELPNPDPVSGRPEHGGRDRHIAMQINSIENLRIKLENTGIPYTASKSGRKAIFCRDPDGNALEFIE